MEQYEQEPHSYQKKERNFFTKKRWRSIRLGLLSLITTAGCTSTASSTPSKSRGERETYTQTKHRNSINNYPWSGNEEKVKNTVLNLHHLKSEAQIKLQAEEKMEILQRIDVIKKLIDESEESLRQGKSDELEPTLSWLHEINLWALQEIEALSKR